MYIYFLCGGNNLLDFGKVFKVKIALIFIKKRLFNGV